jgi:SAM-dependent methyltransferase
VCGCGSSSLPSTVMILGSASFSLGRIISVYDRVAHLARGPWVLDLGCGTGSVALRLAARGLHVTGVDLSPEMLDFARQKATSGTSLRWVEAGGLEIVDHFQPAAFDTIITVLLFSELSASEQAETLTSVSPSSAGRRSVDRRRRGTRRHHTSARPASLGSAPSRNDNLRPDANYYSCGLRPGGYGCRGPLQTNSTGK